MEEISHVTTACHHPQPSHFAEELVTRLPEGEDWVVHFVNSGAETVDLAVLIARAATQHYGDEAHAGRQQTASQKCSA